MGMVRRQLPSWEVGVMKRLVACVRGGAYASGSIALYSNERGRFDSETRSLGFGFRVVGANTSSSLRKVIGGSSNSSACSLLVLSCIVVDEPQQMKTVGFRVVKALAGEQNSIRVVRGGAFGIIPYWLRSAFRDGYHPVIHSDALGFRITQPLIRGVLRGGSFFSNSDALCGAYCSASRKKARDDLFGFRVVHPR